MTRLEILPVTGIPEIEEGADLAGLVLAAIERDLELTLVDGDILVVTSKIISKAGGLRAPAEQRVATVLAESSRVVAERATPGGVTRITQTLAGPVMAGAGIDGSNVGGRVDEVLLLPRDPDAAARSLRAQLIRATGVSQLGVVISDTAGRPWRVGQTDLALGAAGVPVLDDLRGRNDADGRALSVTARAIGDELAAAADLVKGKSDGVPVAIVRGLQLAAGPVAQAPVDSGDPAGSGPELGARELVRTGPGDWFALGSVEAVRAALGAPPGTEAAVTVGIPSTAPEDLEARIQRAARLATLPGSLGALPSGHPRAHTVVSTVDPAQARVHLQQTGVLVESDDPFVTGLVVARLLVALQGEAIPARLARSGARAFIVIE